MHKIVTIPLLVVLSFVLAIFAFFGGLTLAITGLVNIFT